MEVALILYMCSNRENLFRSIRMARNDDKYGCMVQGTRKWKKDSRSWAKRCQQYDLYIKFECTEFKIILQNLNLKLQPRIVLSVCPSRRTNKQRCEEIFFLY